MTRGRIRFSVFPRSAAGRRVFSFFFISVLGFSGWDSALAEGESGGRSLSSQSAYSLPASTGEEEDFRFDGGKIIVRLSSPAEEPGRVLLDLFWDRPLPSREHKPWIWDPGFQIYQPGTEKEDALVFFWRDPRRPGFLDIWIWRAERSAGMKRADDLSGVYDERSGCFSLKFDGDGPPWRCTFPVFYEGDRLSRYCPVRPRGSAGDVSAEAAWESGKWHVRLSRLARTGASDDLPFSGEMEFFVHPLGPGTFAGEGPSEFPFRRISFPDLLPETTSAHPEPGPQIQGKLSGIIPGSASEGESSAQGGGEI